MYINRFFSSSYVTKISLPLLSSVHKLPDDVELEWRHQAEVLYYRLERSHSSAVPQLKHNPWSLKCHQQHLQRMKENAKHRNQYSIPLLPDTYTGLFLRLLFANIQYHSGKRQDKLFRYSRADMAN